MSALALLAIASMLSLRVGAQTTSWAAVWQGTFGVADSLETRIVSELRLSRTLLGLAVGSALGAAGALMQSVTRNPLADPGILGVNAGAAAGLIVGLSLQPAAPLSAYVWWALLGAGVATTLVFGIASASAQMTVVEGIAANVRLILSGVAVGAVMAGVTSAIALSNEMSFIRARYWILGSLTGRPIEMFEQVLPLLIAGLVLGWILAQPLNVLALGDEVATALGGKPGRIRAWTAIAIVLLCGTATAAAGPLTFVGLMVPHAVRPFTGVDLRWLVPVSGVTAAALVVLADTAGRVLVPTTELQVSVVIAILGAPVFIVLTRRS